MDQIDCYQNMWTKLNIAQNIGTQMIFLPKIFCPTFSVLATLWFRQMLTSTGWCLLKFANGSTLIKNLVNMRKSSTWMTIKFWTKLPSLLTHFSPFHFLFPTKSYFYQYITIYFLSLYQYQTQFLPLYQYQREEGMKKCQWRIEE